VQGIWGSGKDVEHKVKAKREFQRDLRSEITSFRG